MLAHLHSHALLNLPTAAVDLLPLPTTQSCFDSFGPARIPVDGSLDRLACLLAYEFIAKASGSVWCCCHPDAFLLLSPPFAGWLVCLLPIGIRPRARLRLIFCPSLVRLVPFVRALAICSSRMPLSTFVPKSLHTLFVLVPYPCRLKVVWRSN